MFIFLKEMFTLSIYFFKKIKRKLIMNTLLPIFIKLENKSCLVVGAGFIAAQKKYDREDMPTALLVFDDIINNDFTFSKFF